MILFLEQHGSRSVSRASSASRRSDMPIGMTKTKSMSHGGAKVTTYSPDRNVDALSQHSAGYQYETRHTYAANNDEYAVPIPRSMTLPRQNGHSSYQEEYVQQSRSQTLPRQTGPMASSTPEPPSEAVVEEERVNADGKVARFYNPLFFIMVAL